MSQGLRTKNLIFLCLMATFASCRGETRKPTRVKIKEAKKELALNEAVANRVIEPVSLKNARIRCQFVRLDSAQYEVSCLVVALQNDGTEFATKKKRDDVSWAWLDMKSSNKNFQITKCENSRDSILYKCAINTTDPDGFSKISLGLSINSQGGSDARVEVASILLPYSLGRTAGHVAKSPYVFKTIADLDFEKMEEDRPFGNQIMRRNTHDEEAKDLQPEKIKLLSVESLSYNHLGELSIYDSVAHKTYFIGTDDSLSQVVEHTDGSSSSESIIEEKSLNSKSIFKIAKYFNPIGLFKVSDDSIYIAEGQNHRIRLIEKGIGNKKPKSMVTIFGDGDSIDCISGKNSGDAVFVGISNVCIGEKFVAIAGKEYCSPGEEGTIKIAIAQSFSAREFNVVEILRPCKENTSQGSTHGN